MSNSVVHTLQTNLAALAVRKPDEYTTRFRKIDSLLSLNLPSGTSESVQKQPLTGTVEAVVAQFKALYTHTTAPLEEASLADLRTALQRRLEITQILDRVISLSDAQSDISLLMRENFTTKRQIMLEIVNALDTGNAKTTTMARNPLLYTIDSSFSEFIQQLLSGLPNLREGLTLDDVIPATKEQIRAAFSTRLREDRLPYQKLLELRNFGARSLSALKRALVTSGYADEDILTLPNM